MSTKPTVFISDPSVEAERVTQALRSAELHVVDVPLSMLVARVAVQRPDVVIVDADAEGALEVIARMRELEGAEGIDVIFCGRPGATLSGTEDALAHEGSGFFARPIQVPALLEKVQTLTGGETRSSPPSRPPAKSGPPSRPPSRPPGSLRPPVSQRVAPPTSVVSPELANLLSRAEDAVEAPPPSDQVVPSPEEEINAVLPEDVLAALDAPLEGDDEEEDLGGPSRVTTSGGRSATTGVREPTTGPGTPAQPTAPRPPSAPPDPLTSEVEARTSDGTTQAHRSIARARSEPPEPPPNPPRRPSSIPPTHLQAPSALSSTLGSELLVQQGGMIAAPAAAPVAAFGQGASSQPLSPAPSTFEAEPPKEMSVRAVSVPRTPGPSPLGPDEAPRVLANAIAARQTGALTFDTPTGVRRVVLREGDLVTAASGADSESLLAFLGARGDLTRERVEALAGRLPPYGRHAGAALVAQGALGQEQLWPVLRAHAEYVIGQVLLSSGGTWLLDPEPPGRLKTEPSVFGGAPGAEIFVDVVRRVVPHAQALRRCGGSASVVAEGPRAQLLRECGLAPADMDAVRLGRGERLETIVASRPEGDLASVVYALWLLGIVELARSAFERPLPSERPGGADAIDEEAVRNRIRARLELVDEGDYFALLGVPHNATGYEVRRAYLDLRRSFDPSRLLTPGLIDLAEDVRRITSVLEEAYEILGDNARRERYRRAIDQPP